MNSTYTAPAVVTTGDVVRTTLGGKPQVNEASNPATRTSGGSNLSFGL